ACRFKPTRCLIGDRSISGCFSRYMTSAARRAAAKLGYRVKLRDRLLHAAAILGRGTPLILQTETAECGLACLAMIAARYGHRVDLPALRQRFNPSLRGMTLHDLVRTA